MEGLISDRLKHYSYFRSKLLEKPITTQALLRNSNLLFHSIIIFTTFILMSAIFIELRSLTLFSLHPICMSIGTFIFLAEGIIAYKNSGLLDTLSPIMQHSKRTKVRSIHQSMQIIGGIFLGLGMLMILANKLEYQKSIFPHTVHSLLGSLTLILIVVQIITGQQKLLQMDVSNSKIRRWHGDAGLLIWDLLCLTVLAGLISFLSFGFCSVLAEVCVVTSWFAVHSQMTLDSRDKSGGSNVRPAVSREELSGADDADGPNNNMHEFDDRSFESDEMTSMLTAAADSVVGVNSSNAV